MKKQRQHMMAKILSIFALLSILAGILGTGILFLFSGYFVPESSQEVDLQKLLESMSGSVEVSTGDIQNTQTETNVD